MGTVGANKNLTRVPPGPSHHLLLGSLLNFRRDMLGTWQRAQRQYGDVIQFRLGHKPVVVLCHPDMAERVFITEKEKFKKIYEKFPRKGLALIFGKGVFTAIGKEWKQQRQVMQPMFHRSQIISMAPLMTAAGDRLLARWRLKAAAGESVDLMEEMSEVTMDVITTTMFSVEVLARAQKLAHDMATCVRYVGESFVNPLMPPTWVPTKRNRAYIRALRRVDNLIYEMIDAHANATGARGDLLDVFLSAKFSESGEPMSRELIRDQVAGIFGAGHETTSCALTWTWHLLNENPQAKQRLKQELKSVLDGRTPTVADLPNLPYTRTLLEESMRLYPPVPSLPRIAAEDVEIDGYRIRAGTMVLVSFYNIQRHPEFWANPDRFDPERFASNDSQPRHRCAYLPFGVGPRVCLGSHFAMMEAQFLLAQMAQRFDVQVVAGQQIDTEVVTTLRPRNSLMVTLHPVSH